ncbi:MAG: heme-binding protein [Woeseia sp.]
MTMTLERAQVILSAAVEHAEKIGTAPLTIAVIDTGGHLKALWRQDGASTLRPEMATAKARTAIGLGKSSRKVAEDAQARPAFIGALATLAEGNILPAAGGVLAFAADGVLAGAVGITGDTSDRDEECAIAGIEAAGLVPQV